MPTRPKSGREKRTCDAGCTDRVPALSAACEAAATRPAEGCSGFMGLRLRLANTRASAVPSERALCAVSSDTTQPDSATMRLPAAVFGAVNFWPRWSPRGATARNSVDVDDPARSEGIRICPSRTICGGHSAPTSGSQAGANTHTATSTCGFHCLQFRPQGTRTRVASQDQDGLGKGSTAPPECKAGHA
jgi:hypothetical protein